MYERNGLLPKIYGPYKCTDGRKRVVLVYASGQKPAKSYARFLMEQHLNRELDADEEVDHIDGNFTNDVIDNLQILTGRKNRQKSVVENNMIVKMWTGNCPICSVEFSKPLSRVKGNLKMGKSGPYCSRQCAGLVGK